MERKLKVMSEETDQRGTKKKIDPIPIWQIQKMLEKADQRGRVAILLMASTGMRVGAIPLLKIRNLERLEKYSLYKVTVYENEG